MEVLKFLLKFQIPLETSSNGSKRKNEEKIPTKHDHLLTAHWASVSKMMNICHSNVYFYVSFFIHV